jgi:dolichol-phosphate mannosyltransferase
MKERVLVFIPMYNCRQQIGRVIRQFRDVPSGLIAEILMLDNRSTDGTLDAAAAAVDTHRPDGLQVTLCRNAVNYSLGGSHKVAFNYALEHHFDYVVVLHGDDQGSISDVVPYLARGDHRAVDSLLGSRFMRGSRLTNYSLLRIVGNRIFNAVFSLVARRWLTDLGSGLNVYKTSFLASRFYLRFPNALTFNYYMILYTVGAGGSFRFFPLSWREEDQASNVRLVRQTIRMLDVVRQYAVNRRRFMTAWHESEKPYSTEVMRQWMASVTASS